MEKELKIYRRDAEAQRFVRVLLLVIYAYGALPLARL